MSSTNPTTTTVTLTDRQWRILAAGVDALRTIRLAQGMPAVSARYGEALTALVAQLDAAGTHDAVQGV